MLITISYSAGTINWKITRFKHARASRIHNFFPQLLSLSWPVKTLSVAFLSNWRVENTFATTSDQQYSGKDVQYFTLPVLSMLSPIRRDCYRLRAACKQSINETSLYTYRYLLPLARSVGWNSNSERRRAWNNEVVTTNLCCANSVRNFCRKSPKNVRGTCGSCRLRLSRDWNEPTGFEGQL